MSIGWVVLGTILQLFLALFLFMFVGFTAGGIANGRSLRKYQSAILDLSLYFLPATCIICAGIVIYQYNNSGSVNSYWWYALPLLLTGCYLIYALKISRASY